MRPLILLTNDDGIEAEGILALANALCGLGELWVIAPRHEQSAVSQAITIRDPIRALPWTFEVQGKQIEARAITGTPADCVKIAVNEICPRKPDLVVSGINHGPNSAVNALYSGTVGAALEGAVNGCKSMAISLNDFRPADFSGAAWAARKIAEQMLGNETPLGTILNVNVPALPQDQIQGFEVTRQAKARWVEEFQQRTDMMQRPYYWLGGYFINLDEGEETDLQALDKGFVSVTPLKIDMTDHLFAQELKQWFF